MNPAHMCAVLQHSERGPPKKPTRSWLREFREKYRCAGIWVLWSHGDAHVDGSAEFKHREGEHEKVRGLLLLCSCVCVFFLVLNSLLTVQITNSEFPEIFTELSHMSTLSSPFISYVRYSVSLQYCKETICETRIVWKNFDNQNNNVMYKKAEVIAFLFSK